MKPVKQQPVRLDGEPKYTCKYCRATFFGDAAVRHKAYMAEQAKVRKL